MKNHYSLTRTFCFLALLFLSKSILAQRPTINSFSPTNGPIGTSVTILGTNFNATAAQNIVYFGATRATVTAASATSLTVTVPSGATYKAITVLNNTTHLTGSSAAPFNVTFTGGAINTATFDPKVDLLLSADIGDPSAILISDLDGDGKSDLVVCHYYYGFLSRSIIISVFRNTSSSGTITAGSFASKVDFTINGILA
jgi:hypothetical protein